MNFNKKTLKVFKESYQKKSLMHLVDSFWLFIYSILKFKSLKSATKEQDLNKTILQLEKIIKNYDDQYNYVKIKGDYWNYKVRALHAFQINFGIHHFDFLIFYLF